MEPVAVDAPIATATGAFFTRRQLAVVVGWPPPKDPAPSAADAWGDAAAAARGASAMGGALLALKLCPRLAASAAFVTASAVPYGLGRRSAARGDVDERGNAAFSHVRTIDDTLLVLEAWNARPTLSLRVAAGDTAVVLDLARFVFPLGYVQSPGVARGQHVDGVGAAEPALAVVAAAVADGAALVLTKRILGFDFGALAALVAAELRSRGARGPAAAELAAGRERVFLGPRRPACVCRRRSRELVAVFKMSDGYLDYAPLQVLDALRPELAAAAVAAPVAVA